MDFAPVMVGYWNCRDDDHVNSPADVGAMNVNFTAQIQHAQHLRTWTLFFEAVCVSRDGGVCHMLAPPVRQRGMAFRRMLCRSGSRQLRQHAVLSVVAAVCGVRCGGDVCRRLLPHQLLSRGLPAGTTVVVPPAKAVVISAPFVPVGLHGSSSTSCSHHPKRALRPKILTQIVFAFIVRCVRTGRRA